jgi:L-rhamnose mutarotase
LTIVSDGLGTVLDYARTGKQERLHKRPWDELIAMLRKAGAKSSSY